MNGQYGHEAAAGSRIERILGEYLEDLDAGRAPGHAELLARYPELAGELATFFAEQERLLPMVAPLPAAAEAARGLEPTEVVDEATTPPMPSVGIRPRDEERPDPGVT